MSRSSRSTDAGGLDPNPRAGPYWPDDCGSSPAKQVLTGRRLCALPAVAPAVHSHGFREHAISRFPTRVER